MNSYKATCNMFKRMEVAEKVYEYGTTSKIPIRKDANCPSHGRKRKGGEAASPTKPRKVCAGKRKIIDAGNRSNWLTGEKNACCMTPETLQKRANYSKNTLPSTPCSGHTINKKLAPVATKNVVIPSSSTAQQKR